MNRVDSIVLTPQVGKSDIVPKLVSSRYGVQTRKKKVRRGKKKKLMQEAL